MSSSAFPTSSPGASSRRHRTGRIMPGMAVAGLVAVIGSLIAGPAHASETTLAEARAAISSSVTGGTYEQDIISGKITIEQIVDVNLAVRSTAAATAITPAPSREELTRQATQELAHLRTTGSLNTPDLSPTTGSRPATDPLVENKHWWNKLSHWATIPINAQNLAIGSSVGASTLAALLGACSASGAAICAAVAGMSFLTVTGLGLEGIKCLAYGERTFYVKIPDFWNSHCGN